MDVDVDVIGNVPVDIVGTVPVSVSGGLGAIGPVTLDGGIDSVGPVGPVTLEGIPDTFHIHLDTINLPKINIGIDPLTLNLAITEFPSVRAHVPADFNLGLSVFGLDVFCIRLCGEAQIITEPYRPNPCERCGPPLTRTPAPIPTPTPAKPPSGMVATAALAYPSGPVRRVEDNP